MREHKRDSWVSMCIYNHIYRYSTLGCICMCKCVHIYPHTSGNRQPFTSIYFLALSHAPPVLDAEMATWKLTSNNKYYFSLICCVKKTMEPLNPCYIFNNFYVHISKSNGSWPFSCVNKITIVTFSLKQLKALVSQKWKEFRRINHSKFLSLSLVQREQ